MELKNSKVAIIGGKEEASQVLDHALPPDEERSLLESARFFSVNIARAESRKLAREATPES